MRKILVILAVGALVAAGACGKSKSSSAKGPTGPQSYVVDADAAAPATQQIAAYFPGVLKVRPGDTITFANKSAHDPHTITFGISADHSNAPAPVINGGKNINPAEFQPCFADTSSPTMTCPPPPAVAPAYTGKGYWNSGWLAADLPNKSYKMTLGTSIAPGEYSYTCLLHPFMQGTIQVVAKDGDRLSPSAVAAAAATASRQQLANAAALKPPAATPGTVSAGYGDRIIAVMAFEPSTITIKAGETVTWKPGSLYEPHTVTFQSPFKSPGDPGATLPLGVKSGGSYTGGATSSGIFGPKPFPFPTDSFSLKFPKAGTYDYVCILHDGMKGTVTVTA